MRWVVGVDVAAIVVGVAMEVVIVVVVGRECSQICWRSRRARRRRLERRSLAAEGIAALFIRTPPLPSPPLGKTQFLKNFFQVTILCL